MSAPYDDGLMHLTLFEIHRSVNRNRVVYRARVDASTGGLDAARPVEAFWVDVEPETLAQNAKRGLGSRSELTALEKRLAFGFDATMEADGTATMSLRALPHRTLRVGIDAATGRPYAAAMAGERPKLCTLRRIDVDVEHAVMGLVPRVRGIVLTGACVEDGSAMREELDAEGRRRVR